MSAPVSAASATAASCIRSHLFRITAWDGPAMPRKLSSASGQSASLPSSTMRDALAPLAAFTARRTPSASIRSPVCRTPAVSSNVTGTPLISRRTETTSRVVPASSDTIAASRPARRFSRVDFPALTGPSRLTVTPLRTCSPIRPSSRTPSIVRISALLSSRSCASTEGGRSSSAKSISASSRPPRRTISSRHPVTGL